MNNSKILYGIGGLIIGLLIATIFFPDALNRNDNGMMNMGNNMDEHFIDQMIPHHEDAITMAELAKQKAEHQEIKDLAADIITAQNAEIEQMRQWRRDWFGIGGLFIPQAMAHNMEHGLNMGLMGDLSDLEDLENAKPFDKKFIEAMIPHHQMAVMMAQMLWQTTQREEMKKISDDIITAQNAEIEQMRTWYKAWY
ncbi:MAG: hypothetical protein A3B10_03645 [Candidatus Doudnabacteria bacterium RIFCSPLOWO2_01_FULL_44_21]|uniref:DUF305 domain-containing protein n=1 Tax=Candidatus Doudnabacteria bacterium RIFCSPLOWO2_01_FULL_44_21 TaxID=1817841 RepID=A0A1F5PYD3_9BACT|nr:MAG: hypothetical protein A3B95_02200 [Candidatus Doudnabacteria bacterium RIFCSPHIGHO2_02_FULL_43_13b]OGE94857.1 MAG: hypothetical protein A3B10_03645 [Candidatus Doudnabacteria bacterium RIFCSPLOWO2_01_FULL_44_21]